MATLPNPRTWAAGESLTGAKMNTEVRDALNFLLSPPLAKVRQATAQSIPNATWTAITFDTEDANTDAMHSTTTNPSRLTASTAGWYWVSGAVSLAANGTGLRFASLRKNGTGTAVGMPGRSGGFVPGTANDADLMVSHLVQLSAGDWVELMVFQNSTVALNTAVTGDGASSLEALWVSK